MAYYAGCDEHNLALYAVGAAGYVSTVANVVPAQLRAVLDTFDAGETTEAARLQQRATELVELMMASGLPGTVTTKALLSDLNLPSGPVRAPLRPADRTTAANLRAAYERLVTPRAPTLPYGERMSRPLLYLDVDGPLNPYAAKPTQRPHGLYDDQGGRGP